MEVWGKSVTTSRIVSIPLLPLFLFSMRTFIASMMTGEVKM